MAKLSEIFKATSRSVTSLNIAALQWLQGKYTQIVTGRGLTPSQIIREGNQVQRLEPGDMYFFAYLPATRKKLPYYDLCPLMIPIEEYSSTQYLGINFHYLPYNLRQRLLNNLMERVQRGGDAGHGDQGVYFRIDYNLIKTVARFKEAKPCIHRYNLRQLRSRIVVVNEEDWQMAIHLPVERFQKASKRTIWSDSRRIIREGI